MTTILLHPEEVHIPGDIASLARFREWTHSEAFPERGRFDWIEGQLEVDMSPEDLNTHGSPKSAIASRLHALVEETGRGVVYIDRARLSAPTADLSVEPDIVVVFFDSLEAGRVRLVPRAGGGEGRYGEIEGAPDLVVECVSDSSVTKDRQRLRERYHRAGAREYWIVDARGTDSQLTILRRAEDGFVEAASGAGHYTRSDVLGASLRLVRLPARAGLVRHRLEVDPA